MSYKHNNLMTMRERLWQEHDTTLGQSEFQILKNLLQTQHIFESPNAEDLKYFLFCIPSNILIKAHAIGFQSQQPLLAQFINEHRQSLIQRQPIQVVYRYQAS